MEIRHEPGWIGAFTREQSVHARFANGARILKTRSESGDATPLGTQGTVLGSIYAPGEPCCGYFIEWDDKPRHALFVVEWKLGRADQ